jgi:hypothetical protein
MEAAPTEPSLCVEDVRYRTPMEEKRLIETFGDEYRQDLTKPRKESSNILTDNSAGWK